MHPHTSNLIQMLTENYGEPVKTTETRHLSMPRGEVPYSVTISKWPSLGITFQDSEYQFAVSNGQNQRKAENLLGVRWDSRATVSANP